MRGRSIHNIITKIFREENYQWVLPHFNVKPSCVSSHDVTFFNPESNQKEVFPEMLMEVSVRDLQNYMIKPFENGGLASVVDYVTQKVLIYDTTLRSFIPPQVRKMTHKLRHISGCEICIIPKDMHIDLNIFITILVTNLQQ